MKRRSTKTAVSQGMRALLLLLALLLASAGCNTTNPPVETTPEEESSTGEETTSLEETTDTDEETTDGETTTEEDTLHPFESLEKQYCQATVEDAFADDRILLLMMPFANFTEYTTEDFAYVGCIEMRDLWTNIKPNKVCRIIGLTLDKKSKQNVLDMIKILEQRDDILAAHPNYYGELMTASEYYINNSLYPYDSGVKEMISLPEAWELETGSSSVLVGLIDSGVDGTHPYLVDCINTTLSRNFSPTYTTALEDAEMHGTAMAGLICANPYMEGASEQDEKNLEAISGVSQNIQLVSLRVTVEVEEFDEETGIVTTTHLIDIFAMIDAVNYADDIGIDIINASNGFYEMREGIPALEAAIQNFSGFYVSAAGNRNLNIDEATIYPRISGYSNVIRVSGCTADDERNTSLAYGKTKVDLFAPAFRTVTTAPYWLVGDDFPSELGWNEYDRYLTVTGGTSMATALVTGVAALMLSHDPTLTPSEIKTIIMNNVDIVYDEDGNSVYGNYCVSGGRLNAYKAVLATRHIHDLYENITDTSHDFSCSICDEYDYDVAHEYFRYTINTAPTIGSQHRAHCDCGYYRVEYHVVRASPTDGTTFPAACIFCGLLATDGDIILLNVPGELVQMGVQSVPGSYTLSDGTTIQILTENGSYVLPSGIIVLSEADAALVEAGLLDPYELVESPTVPSNPGHVTE
ncbi:MAG: S8 family serine peptidase [Clostridia bacterium]|nr:S8 family serine peptidase [Clostridia bacterium]